MMNGSISGGGGGTTLKMKTLSVKLERDGQRTAWGIRLIGGVDLGAPLTVQRVQVGSPAEGVLRRGDIIRKIGDYDARDLAHKEAQNLFKTAGNNVNVVVQRSSAAAFSSSYSSMTSTQTFSQSTVNPPVAGGVPTPFAAATLPRASSSPRTSALPSGVTGLSVTMPGRGGTPGRAASPMPSSMLEALKSPVESLPHTIFPVAQPGLGLSNAQPPRAPSPFPCVQPPPNQDPELEAVTNQPYRTTPLVLPGAKTKKDIAPTTSSYLRHHPNPMFRAPPSHFDSEAMMKQKVAGTVIDRVAGQEINGAKIVHKQFNSPIGLYSDQNIAETIQQQTGATPPKPPPVFDPLKSEAYKALKEEELGIRESSVPAEVSPVQPKVFQPGAVPPPKQRPPPPATQAQPYHQPQPHKAVPGAKVNSIGMPDEKIAQSYSFKRIMAEVLGETEF